MAELKPQERLQPSLLDRLTDDEPDRKQESRHHRVLSQRRLRYLVRRDLVWLLNTGQLSATVDLSNYPLVAESVLNYGIPSLAGHTLSSLELPLLEKSLKEAIVAFEPRILQGGLRVRIVQDEKESRPSGISFVIEGQLWADPSPERLYMRTQLDLETGDARVEEFSD